MIINKNQAAMIFAAIVELNEPEKVIEILGEENATSACEVIKDMSDNITMKERRENAALLLKQCCDFILADDSLPTRLEGSD